MWNETNVSKIVKESVLLVSLFLIAALVQLYASRCHGALFLFFADSLFGLPFRTASRHAYCVCLRNSGGPAEFLNRLIPRIRC